MHDAERAVTLGDCRDDDAEAEHIGELLEAHRLPLHFAPDRIGSLAPADDFGRNTAIGEFSGELLFDLGDRAARSVRERFKPFGNHPIGLGIEFAERQILEFLAQLMHAHPAGERRVDVESFLRGPPPRLRRPVGERSHVVQPVGELDKQHAHVVGDGEQKLAQVFGLLGLLGYEFEPL